MLFYSNLINIIKLTTQGVLGFWGFGVLGEFSADGFVRKPYLWKWFSEE
jgi:hypothetical protein